MMLSDSKTQLSEKVKSVSINENQTVEVGDLLLAKSRDDLYRVIDIKQKGDFTRVVYDGYRYNDERISDMGISDIKNYYTVIKGVSREDMTELADKIFNGEIKIEDLEERQSESSSTELMKMDQAFYENALQKAEHARNRIAVIECIVRQKTEEIKRRVGDVLAVQKRLVSKLNAIVFTLELYAGIEEQVKQIQSGSYASDDEPIYLNQIMRFMDEEVGDPENEGLTYERLEDFDEWLLKKNEFLNCINYELLLPQRKCVRIMRVRRDTRRSLLIDRYNNHWKIKEDMSTYLLIRNGENIYTIDSKLEFSERLFPEKEELTKIMEIENDDTRYDALEKYKNGMVLMQGLIDRTTVFGNLVGQVSFLNVKSTEEGKVVFVYELDDRLIGDGTKTFLDFLNTDKIQAGDRILFINGKEYDTRHRLYKEYYSNEYSVPNDPHNGIYKLEWDKEHSCLYFRYLPDGKVYTWSRVTERKKRVSYKVNSGDQNIVNIDRVSHRDIDWIHSMMYDRRDRTQYLRVFGMLKALKKFKSKELKEEEPFAMMLMQQFPHLSELEILDLIHWWKTKNKHKRALTVDDQKALRMISKKIKRYSLDGKKAELI